MKRSIDIIILCAVKNEYKAAKSILDEECITTSAMGRYICTEGRLNNSSCLIILMGVGEKKSKLCFQKTLSIYAPNKVVVFGAAGAINPHLKIGTVTVPKILVNYTVPQLELEGKELDTKLKKSEYLNNIVVTKAGTCKNFISSRKLKESILNILKLDTTDCETYHIASICEKMKIPFIAFRCITDSADNKALFHYFLNSQEILNKCAQTIKESIFKEINWE